jgi:hypothetical protein
LKKREKRVVDPASWVLLLCFVISLAALIIYLIDLDFSDATLFLLIRIIRYSASMLCICAFYKLSITIYSCVRERKFHLVKILAYLVLIVYGIVVILTGSFIITLSGGNG